MTNKNTETVRNIANVLDQIAAGELVKCPHCGEWIEQDDADEWTCPCCGETVQCDEWGADNYAETVDVYEWINDALDLQFVVNSDMSVRGVRVLVAFGGPNIWVDTNRGSVDLAWWNESASWGLSGAARDMLDEWATEYMDMSR